MRDESSMVTNTVKNIIKCADVASSRFLLNMGFESDSLIILYFHSMFANEQEKKIASDVTMSYNGITLDGLRNVIRYYIAAGYTFISPLDILAGLANKKKYVMLTFDDGYANNRITLQTLKEFKVPVVLFVSVRHVLENKCFWWDVVYRELLKRAYSLKYTWTEIQRLKRYKAEEISEYITSNFGPGAFAPAGELDRPFSVKELKEFSRQPYVYIGNHTMDHAILTNYNEAEIRVQISMAQDALQDITHNSLPFISYPSGASSSTVIKLCKEMNFLLGFTIEPEKISLPISNSKDVLLSLGRFSLKSNNNVSILRNCDLARSDFLWSRSLRNVYHHFHSNNLS